MMSQTRALQRPHDDSAFIFEATPDNFAPLVLENSAKGPVLVNYWAPWAGPCMKLWQCWKNSPTTMVGASCWSISTPTNTRRWARDYGINSLPTLKLFRPRPGS